MKYYLYNPLARAFKLQSAIDKLKNKDLIRMNDEVEMQNLINNIQTDDEIYLAGGDGTLQHFLQTYPQLLDYKIFYHPSGSGNDFARSISDRYPYYYGVQDSYKDYNYFINGMGIGFDALICYKANNAVKKSKVTYIVEAYKSLKEYKPIDIDIVIDGVSERYENVWLCSLQNGAYFGGGIEIAPDALVDHPEIDVIIAHGLTSKKVFSFLAYLKMGKMDKVKDYFTFKKAKSVIIKTDEAVLAQFDGNTKLVTTPLDLSYSRQIKLQITDSFKDDKVKEEVEELETEDTVNEK